MPRDQLKKVFALFCPSVPITDPSRLVGREQECIDLARALLAPGRHVVVFGDRGVGKTSTAKVVTTSLCKDDSHQFIEYQCGTMDTYMDIVGKVLADCGKLSIAKKKSDSHEQVVSAGIRAIIADGGAQSKRTAVFETVDLVQVNLTPDLFARHLVGINGIALLDEFDRIKDEDTKRFFAETMKALSNYNSGLKFLICGVSNSASTLIGTHQSMNRNLKAIKIPYMPPSDLRRIIDDGLEQLSISFDSRLKDAIVWVSCGLPYFTHLLCEELAVYAITKRRNNLNLLDLRHATQLAINNVADGIEADYEHAVSDSPSPTSFFSSADPNQPSIGSNQTPRQVKRFVVHAVALTAGTGGTLDKVAIVVQRLVSITGAWMPHEYAQIDGVQIETILEEIAEVQPYIEISSSRASFNSPFHRAYALLRALTEYERIPPTEILSLGMPEC